MWTERKWSGDPLTIAIICASAVFVYLLVFKFPATPIYIENDSLIFLSDAQRMAAGEVIYRDFFQFTFPGLQVLYRGLFAVFGEVFWLSPFLVVLITAASAAVTIAVAKRLGNGFTAVAPAVVFVFFGARYYGLEGTHRMISPIVIMLAVLALVRTRTSTWHIAVSAGLCALASFFTQPRGIAAVGAVVAWLLIEKLTQETSWKIVINRISVAIASFGVVLAVLCSYFIGTSGFETFWNSTIVYPWLYYGAAEQNSGSILLSDLSTAFATTSLQGIVAALAAVLYGVVVPLGAIVCSAIVFWRAFHDWEKWRGHALIALVWLALLFSTFGPSPVRLYEISAPALLLIFGTLPRGILASRRLKMLATGATGILLILAASQIWRTQVFWTYHVLPAPTGNLAFFDGPLAERYVWLLAHTQPGDPIYEARQPYAYFPLQLRNPTPISQVWESDYTRTEHIDAVIRGLQNTPPKYVLWEIPYDKPADQRPPGDHLAPLYEYLQQNYKRVPNASWTIEHGSAIEVWERVP